MDHAQSEVEELTAYFKNAADDFDEATAAVGDHSCADGPLRNDVKAYVYSCAVGAAEKIERAAIVFSGTPEYRACKRCDDDYGLTILTDASFRAALGRCVEAANTAADTLGVGADRIAATLNHLVTRRVPDYADDLRSQAEASARVWRMRAAKAVGF